MRSLTHLSPSSIATWQRSSESFFVRYLADERQPHEPQTRAAAAGSAFDAFVKDSFSRGTLETLLAANVDEGERAWAREQGAHLLISYQQSGAWDDLADWLRESGRVEFDRKLLHTIDGVPLLGLIDCYWVGAAGAVVLDWKVRGYCGKQTTSPTKGYCWCRDGYSAAKQSKSHKKAHKDCALTKRDGRQFNAVPWELNSESYAQQLTIYAALVQAETGRDCIVCAIDELCCAPHESGWPLTRVAEHRAMPSPGYQASVLNLAREIWETCQSGHIFRELSRADSDARCAALNESTALSATQGIFHDLTKGADYYG